MEGCHLPIDFYLYIGGLRSRLLRAELIASWESSNNTSLANLQLDAVSYVAFYGLAKAFDVVSNSWSIYYVKKSLALSNYFQIFTRRSIVNIKAIIVPMLFLNIHI